MRRDREIELKTLGGQVTGSLRPLDLPLTASSSYACTYQCSPFLIVTKESFSLGLRSWDVALRRRMTDARSFETAWCRNAALPVCSSVRLPLVAIYLMCSQPRCWRNQNNFCISIKIWRWHITYKAICCLEFAIVFNVLDLFSYYFKVTLIHNPMA